MCRRAIKLYWHCKKVYIKKNIHLHFYIDNSSGHIAERICNYQIAMEAL